MSFCIKIEHPIVQHYLSQLRDKNTNSDKFREILKKLNRLVVYKVTEDLETKNVQIETPLTHTTSKVIAGSYSIVSILRAGLGFLPSFLEIIPNAKSGFIGICRNHHTSVPELYYQNLPQGIENTEVIVLEPMIATSGSICLAIEILKKMGVNRIKVVSLLTVEEAINKIQMLHPDIQLYTCDIDPELNNHNYIVPGIGDVGDRIFGND